MSLDNRYASKYWDIQARIPGAITPGQVEEVEQNIAKVKQLLDDIPDLSNARLVDIGCGEGRLMEYIAPQVKEYIGADVSELVLNRAKQMAEKKNLLNVYFYNVGEMTSLKQMPGVENIDAVVSFTVFMHMPLQQLEEYFQEVKGILKKGGRFHFDCACTEGQWLDPFTRFDCIASVDLFTARWFPEEEIEQLLSKAGFVIASPPLWPYMIWKTISI